MNKRLSTEGIRLLYAQQRYSVLDFEMIYILSRTGKKLLANCSTLETSIDRTVVLIMTTNNAQTLTSRPRRTDSTTYFASLSEKTSYINPTLND